MLFFMKRCGTEPVVISKIDSQVISGMVERDPLDDLLNKMNQDFMPKLLHEDGWPDGVYKEFIANLHKFMSIITEESHKRQGRTYLYIPNEDLSDNDTAVHDKDLIQRLEQTIIGWTR